MKFQNKKLRVCLTKLSSIINGNNETESEHNCYCTCDRSRIIPEEKHLEQILSVQRLETNSRVQVDYSSNGEDGTSSTELMTDEFTCQSESQCVGSSEPSNEECAGCAVCAGCAGEQMSSTCAIEEPKKPAEVGKGHRALRDTLQIYCYEDLKSINENKAVHEQSMIAKDTKATQESLISPGETKRVHVCSMIPRETSAAHNGSKAEKETETETVNLKSMKLQETKTEYVRKTKLKEESVMSKELYGKSRRRNETEELNEKESVNSLKADFSVLQATAKIRHKKKGKNLNPVNASQQTKTKRQEYKPFGRIENPPIVVAMMETNTFDDMCKNPPPCQNKDTYMIPSKYKRLGDPPPCFNRCPKTKTTAKKFSTVKIYFEDKDALDRCDPKCMINTSAQAQRSKKAKSKSKSREVENCNRLCCPKRKKPKVLSDLNIRFRNKSNTVWIDQTSSKELKRTRRGNEPQVCPPPDCLNTLKLACSTQCGTKTVKMTSQVPICKTKESKAVATSSPGSPSSSEQNHPIKRPQELQNAETSYHPPPAQSMSNNSRESMYNSQSTQNRQPVKVFCECCCEIPYDELEPPPLCVCVESKPKPKQEVDESLSPQTGPKRKQVKNTPQTYDSITPRDSSDMAEPNEQTEQLRNRAELQPQTPQQGNTTETSKWSEKKNEQVNFVTKEVIEENATCLGLEEMQEVGVIDPEGNVFIGDTNLALEMLSKKYKKPDHECTCNPEGRGYLRTSRRPVFKKRTITPKPRCSFNHCNEFIFTELKTMEELKKEEGTAKPQSKKIRCEGECLHLLKEREKQMNDPSTKCPAQCVPERDKLNPDEPCTSNDMVSLSDRKKLEKLKSLICGSSQKNSSTTSKKKGIMKNSKMLERKGIQTAPPPMHNVSSALPRTPMENNQQGMVGRDDKCPCPPCPSCCDRDTTGDNVMNVYHCTIMPPRDSALQCNLTNNTDDIVERDSSPVKEKSRELLTTNKESDEHERKPNASRKSPKTQLGHNEMTCTCDKKYMTMQFPPNENAQYANKNAVIANCEVNCELQGNSMVQSTTPYRCCHQPACCSIHHQNQKQKNKGKRKNLVISVELKKGLAEISCYEDNPRCSEMPSHYSSLKKESPRNFTGGSSLQSTDSNTPPLSLMQLKTYVKQKHKKRDPNEQEQVNSPSNYIEQMQTSQPISGANSSTPIQETYQVYQVSQIQQAPSLHASSIKTILSPPHLKPAVSIPVYIKENQGQPSCAVIRSQGPENESIPSVDKDVPKEPPITGNAKWPKYGKVSKLSTCFEETENSMETLMHPKCFVNSPMQCSTHTSLTNMADNLTEMRLQPKTVQPSEQDRQCNMSTSTTTSTTTSTQYEYSDFIGNRKLSLGNYSKDTAHRRALAEESRRFAENRLLMKTFHPNSTLLSSGKVISDVERQKNSKYRRLKNKGIVHKASSYMMQDKMFRFSKLAKENSVECTKYNMPLLTESNNEPHKVPNHLVLRTKTDQT